MGINITTEKDIERLRVFSQLQDRENAQLRRRLAASAQKLAKRDGLDPQEVLEALMGDIAININKDGATNEDSALNPLTSKSERWSGQSSDKDDSANDPAKTGHGPTDQPDVETQEVLFELDEADQACPKCGAALKAIEGLTEDSTEVDIIEVRYILRTVKKQKYRCTCSDCQHIETALGPETPKAIPKGRYTLDFALQVLADKYESHLPLERQTQRMKAHKLKVSSQTLWDYTWACTKWLLPSWEAHRLDVLAERVVGADETRWRLMGRGDDAKPQIIALTSDAGVWYGFEHDKKAQTIDRLLGDFEGVLIADGLSIYPAVRDRRLLAYEHLETEVVPFTLAQCWVHARRNFIKASRGDPNANEMVALIAKLYRLKRVYTPELHEIWVTWVDVILKGMQTWMQHQRPRPGSKLAQAIKYMVARWEGLALFRNEPAIWLDNNGTERALRQPIQGRKNHYGSRSENGMQAAAVMYTLFETCKRLHIDALSYFKEAIVRAIQTPGNVYTPAMFLAEKDR